MRKSFQEGCHLGSAVLDLHFTKIIDIWLLGVFYYHFLSNRKVPKVKNLVTFGFSSLFLSLLSGGAYSRVVPPLGWSLLSGGPNFWVLPTLV